MCGLLEQEATLTMALLTIAVYSLWPHDYGCTPLAFTYYMGCSSRGEPLRRGRQRRQPHAHDQPGGLRAGILSLEYWVALDLHYQIVQMQIRQDFKVQLSKLQDTREDSAIPDIKIDMLGK